MKTSIKISHNLPNIFDGNCLPRTPKKSVSEHQNFKIFWESIPP